MKLNISRQMIEKIGTKTVWDIGNDALYKLCKDNPYHRSDDVIVAKVWLIGRSYAAAIERRRINLEKNNDTFYLEDVVGCFKESELDAKLGSLEKNSNIHENVIAEALATHKYLCERVKEITGLEKRSFCSKYLHFHLPELFFLYDSRAASALGALKIKIPTHLKKLIKDSHADHVYADYFCKSYIAKKTVEESCEKKSITIRAFDNLLIQMANQSDR